MTTPSTPSLIINDGSLAGLIAAWNAGSVRSGEAIAPTRGVSASTSLAIVNWFPSSSLPAAANRRTAVERQVNLCGLGSFSDREVIITHPEATRAADGVALDLIARASTTATLVSAAVEAIRSGLSRVVWPIHAGPDTDISIDALADICDRALLISQLMTIDQPRLPVARSSGTGGSGGPASPGSGGEAIKIETPYADFTDAELLELALDLDAPLAACWWCINEGDAPCGTCTECRRWRQALTAADPQGLLDAASLWGAVTAVV